jgi:hypothetical protein
LKFSLLTPIYFPISLKFQFCPHSFRNIFFKIDLKVIFIIIFFSFIFQYFLDFIFQKVNVFFSQKFKYFGTHNSKLLWKTFYKETLENIFRISVICDKNRKFIVLTYFFIRLNHFLPFSLH